MENQMYDTKLNDMFLSAPQAQVALTVKPLFNSYEGRSLFSDFHFGKERDANHFARSYGGLAPAKDFIKGTWVVRL
jgi:hypothetical protein